MELVVSPVGIVRCVYGDAFDLHALGCPQIRRASAVEPDEAGRWWIDLSPVGGPRRIGPYGRRADALSAEVVWLTEHWLIEPVQNSNLRSVNDAGLSRPDRDLDSIGSDRMPGSALRDATPDVTPLPERSSRTCAARGCSC